MESIDADIELFIRNHEVKIKIVVVIKKRRDVKVLGGIQVELLFKEVFFPQEIGLHFTEGIAHLSHAAQRLMIGIEHKIKRHRVEIITQDIEVGEAHDLPNRMIHPILC